MGYTSVIDIKDSYHKFQNKYKNYNPLIAENSVIFDDGKSKYKGSILEKLEDDTFRLRFRNDEFAYFSSQIYPYMNKFCNELLNNLNVVKLEEKQGIIIDNWRMLHERTSFKGEREFWRVLFNDKLLKIKGLNL